MEGGEEERKHFISLCCVLPTGASAFSRQSDKPGLGQALPCLTLTPCVPLDKSLPLSGPVSSLANVAQVDSMTAEVLPSSANWTCAGTKSAHNLSSAPHVCKLPGCHRNGCVRGFGEGRGHPLWPLQGVLELLLLSQNTSWSFVVIRVASHCPKAPDGDDQGGAAAKAAHAPGAARSQLSPGVPCPLPRVPAPTGPTGQAGRGCWGMSSTPPSPRPVWANRWRLTETSRCLSGREGRLLSHLTQLLFGHLRCARPQGVPRGTVVGQRVPPLTALTGQSHHSGLCVWRQCHKADICRFV